MKGKAISSVTQEGQNVGGRLCNLPRGLMGEALFLNILWTFPLSLTSLEQTLVILLTGG